jgi:sporulation protein YlmC with PRC-barrel domain
MSSKNIFGKNLDGAITSDDILGKEVIDIEGSFIGIVEKVFFNSKTLDFSGIAVDKGILKKGLTIGRGYIERIATHAVFLKVSVSYEIKGMTVFDKDGVDLGDVMAVHLKGTTNVIDFLEIKLGGKKRLNIPDIYISSIGDNVLLNLCQKDIPPLRYCVVEKEIKKKEKVETGKNKK